MPRRDIRPFWSALLFRQSSFESSGDGEQPHLPGIPSSLQRAARRREDMERGGMAESSSVFGPSLFDQPQPLLFEAPLIQGRTC